MDRWANGVALVTGASEGIGKAICRELLKNGMNVVGCAAKNVNRIELMAQENEVKTYPGKLLPIKCDLSKEEEILAMFAEIKKEFGRLDVCINNAVKNVDSSLLNGEISDWRSMLEIGILGLCICTREAIKLMKETNRTEGQIIHMSSIVGHKIPPFRKPKDGEKKPWFHIYNSMKWGVRALAEGLRQELKAEESNIRVATISPGATETGMLAKCVNADAAARFYSYYKCLQPSDIADAVIYILKTPEHENVSDIIVEPLDYIS